jgi:hypothetical protein
MKRLLILTAVFALSAFAADISGNWKASAEGPNGSMERTFTFKQEGAKLTGETVSSFAGKSTITNGKVEGDTVTFNIKINLQGNEMDLTYKGKIVSPSEIKFTVEGAGGNTIEWDAKKTS